MSEDKPKDWRNAEINIGDTVIYGSGVGRSIQLNEAVVESYGKIPTGSTPQRVNLRIVRRSYSSGTKEVVSVGSDRLTIVSALPETDKPTQEDNNRIKEEEWQRKQLIKSSHPIPEFNEPEPNQYDYDGRVSQEWTEWWNMGRAMRLADCPVCGLSYYDQYRTWCDESKALKAL